MIGGRYLVDIQTENGVTFYSATYKANSNYGKTSVDVAAPGNNILSTLPGGKYGNMSGTSGCFS